LSINYSNSLKEKYAPHPQIRRISKHRQVPKHIYNATNEHRVIQQKLKRKWVAFLIENYFTLLIWLFSREYNRKMHSKPGTVEIQSQRKKAVVQEHA